MINISVQYLYIVYAPGKFGVSVVGLQNTLSGVVKSRPRLGPAKAFPCLFYRKPAAKTVLTVYSFENV